MTDQQRSTGYRGSLPPRHDRIGAPWVVAVVVIFALMFVLAFLGFPSALTPDATPFPSIPGASAPVTSGAPSVVPSP
jgi:hypothetical protein